MNYKNGDNRENSILNVLNINNNSEQNHSYKDDPIFSNNKKILYKKTYNNKIIENNNNENELIKVNLEEYLSGESDIEGKINIYL